ncbi:MAG: ABC transporter permease [Dehalococcoidia bacterium]|nr:MAG: ABC transporter permease [Dehalococcoidia bacterium]
MFVFFVMRLLPGDPLKLFLGQGYGIYTQEQLEALRALYNLDKPLITQYVIWLGDLLHGDLGISIVTQRPVTEMIAHRLPITINLAFLAFIVSGIFGIAFGTICALNRGKWADTLFSVVANLGITLPIFWVAILLIYGFSVQLDLLPTYGYTSPFEDFWLHIKKLILPVFCMSLFSIGSLTRQTRSSMLEVIQQDYIRTAWAKGLRERTVIVRHMIKNALIPLVTQMGLQARFTLGGAVLIEVVFAIPGLGRMIATGAGALDYQMVQGAVLVTAVLVVVVNIIVDITYAWIDPRIRYD